jgi:Lhr-like helicase
LFPVSVVILTKDVEKNIEDALKSVSDAQNAMGPRLSGEEIRESVRHLDFEDQMKKLVPVCIGDAR